MYSKGLITILAVLDRRDGGPHRHPGGQGPPRLDCQPHYDCGRHLAGRPPTSPPPRFLLYVSPTDGRAGVQRLKDHTPYYNVWPLSTFHSANAAMQSMAVFAVKKRGIPPPTWEGPPMSMGGCPMFSSPGKSCFGILLGDRASTFYHP